MTQMSGFEGRKTTAMAVTSGGPDALPGKEASYSFINLFILAFILEKRTSKSIEDLLRANLFDPLQMYRTRFYGDVDRSIGKPSQPLAHNSCGNIAARRSALLY